MGKKERMMSSRQKQGVHPLTKEIKLMLMKATFLIFLHKTQIRSRLQGLTIQCSPIKDPSSFLITLEHRIPFSKSQELSNKMKSNLLLLNNDLPRVLLLITTTSASKLILTTFTIVSRLFKLTKVMELRWVSLINKKEATPRIICKDQA